MPFNHPTHVVPSTSRRRLPRRVAAALIAGSFLIGAAACTDDPETTATSGSTTSEATDNACRPADAADAVTPEEAAEADVDGTKVTLATHDSFATTDGIFDTFTADTGIEVEVVALGDAGSMVSQAVLTAGDPVADVMFGVDTTFICRATAGGIFQPYASPALAEVADEHEIAVDHLATPIDVGDVCLNYSREAFPDETSAPQTLADLRDERFANTFVTQNPETSSPGMAFLLATIAAFGDDGWEDYWSDLRANGVEVTSGWDEAYYGSFDAGFGERTVVTSYASSPVADVIYSDPPRTEPAIGVVADACFRQVELAGILRGTDHPEAAALLIDFLLSPAFQEDIPLNMFVEPVLDSAEIPAEFAAHRTEITDPLTLTPAEIEAGRDAWTQRWTEIVLR